MSRCRKVKPSLATSIHRLAAPTPPGTLPGGVGEATQPLTAQPLKRALPLRRTATPPRSNVRPAAANPVFISGTAVACTAARLGAVVAEAVAATRTTGTLATDIVLTVGATNTRGISVSTTRIVLVLRTATSGA